jgi:hypothetical protein
MQLIERWFEPVRPSQDYRRQDFVLLLLILAVGTWLRFWHLDNVGLHGDEDIMGLAARGIVEQGVPILPGGMFYRRALAHSYLLAGSTMLFGDNEWALRLPSAVVGSLCGIFAFFMGRRFLDPKPNLAFVALIMFLPAMIDISLTARMYVFFIAGLLIFATLLFRWERNGKVSSLLLALSALAATIHLHPLAVFAAPLFLFPGLANQSWKQAGAGAIAMVSSIAVMRLLASFTSQSYPEESERLDLPATVQQSPIELLFQGHARVAILVAVLVAIAVIAIGTLRLERRKDVVPAVLLFAFGVGACVLLHYHLGGIALLFGAILWLRTGVRAYSRLLIIAGLVGALALMQLFLLHQTGAFPGRTIIGAVVGTPSIWPVLRFVEFSPMGIAVFAAPVAFALHQLCQGRRIPVHFLFFAIAVWAQLLAIGLMRWNVAERYTLGTLPFFLLGVVAGVVYLIGSTGWGARLREKSIATVAVAVVLIGAIINPAAAWQASQNDYSDHPDHKGAAEFIRNLNPGPDDIIIAEDSINQMYYLERVNYRLQNFVGAKNHSMLRDGTLYDQYTGLPVIGSGAELLAVLAGGVAGNIYIIGDGQVSDTLSLRNRGNGISEVLDSDQLEIIYAGRDLRTRVWKLERRIRN